MLQPDYHPPVRSVESAPEVQTPSETFQSILDFIGRQYRVIALAAAVMITLGFIYLLTAAPSYTATTAMLIDTKKIQLFQQQSMINDVPIDASSVESQVEILKSENIALAVIKRLHLTDDPEFVRPSGGPIGTLLGLMTGWFASDEAALRIRVDSCRGWHIWKSVEYSACRSDLCDSHCLSVVQS